jgi:hypothetical protein
MKKLKTISVLIVVLTMANFNVLSQEIQQKKFISEIGFAANMGILGKGDYVGYMNEISLKKEFVHSGISLSMNYVFSSSKGDESSWWGFFDSGYSITMVYSRLNYFITPISLERLSYDIGIGLVGGYVSTVSIYYNGFDFSSSIPYNVSQYDCGWEIGYNIQMSLSLLVNKEIGLSALAGFDVLGSSNSFAYAGVKFIYKIN